MTREADPVARADQTGRGCPKAAWTLIILAPLCAEVTFTGISTPFILLALPLLIPIYGAGVLLVRELVRWAGAGWPGLIVLGIAYEVAEDGIGLQDLTSTNLYTAADWGPRVFGLNTTYWEGQIGYHVVFSVLIPIALTELIFREHASRPWLGRAGLVGATVTFVVGVALARIAISEVEDPGYRQGWLALLGWRTLVAALGVVALVVLPRLGPVRVAPVARPPHRAVAATVAAVATLVWLGLLWPLGHNAGHPAIGFGGWVVIPMVIALVLAVVVGWLVARWCATPGFTDHDLIWLIGGALVGHSLHALASGLAGGSALVPVISAAVILVVTVLLLRKLDRHVSRRAPGGTVAPA
ncbi:MAG TPA: hypothetical protein VH008_07570 [Pseudonocardia sp.]|nr:hypothetical protein [Pseudonocardia sp.]